MTVTCQITRRVCWHTTDYVLWKLLRFCLYYRIGCPLTARPLTKDFRSKGTPSDNYRLSLHNYLFAITQGPSHTIYSFIIPPPPDASPTPDRPTHKKKTRIEDRRGGKGQRDRRHERGRRKKGGGKLRSPTPTDRVAVMPCVAPRPQLLLHGDGVAFEGLLATAPFLGYAVLQYR